MAQEPNRKIRLVDSVPGSPEKDARVFQFNGPTQVQVGGCAAEGCKDQGQSLEDFVAAIKKLAEADSTPLALEKLDPEAWEADWADGLTPSQAWAEERACMAEHRAYMFQRAVNGEQD